MNRLTSILLAVAFLASLMVSCRPKTSSSPFDKAVLNIGKITEGMSDFPDIDKWNEMVRLCKSSKTEQAKSIFADMYFMEVADDNSALLRELGIALASTGRTEEALDLAEKYFKAVNNESGSYVKALYEKGVYVSEVYRMAGELDNAATYLEDTRIFLNRQSWGELSEEDTALLNECLENIDKLQKEVDDEMLAVGVKPLPVSIDVDSLADGIYPVAFEPHEVEKVDGGCEIEFEIFNHDLYDTVELHQLKPGDHILIDGRVIYVDSVSTDGNVIINGGCEKGGYDLYPVGGGVYQYRGFSDYTSYTSYGKVKLVLPDSVEFVDAGNVSESMAGLVIPGKDVYDYLKTVDFGSFNEHSVKIRIEDGRIVEIKRSYRP